MLCLEADRVESKCKQGSQGLTATFDNDFLKIEGAPSQVEVIPKGRKEERCREKEERKPGYPKKVTTCSNH